MKKTRRDFIKHVAAATVGQSVLTQHGRGAEKTLAAHSQELSTPIHEPYRELHGGSFAGLKIDESPDPIVSFRWRAPEAGDELQSYALPPSSVIAEDPKSFEIPDIRQGVRLPVRVLGLGSLRIDFGVESAAWLEFDSPDFSGSVEMSISEFTRPGTENPMPGPDSGQHHRIKTLAPKQYGNTFRLELNPELYEGVRFGWIHVRRFQKPWHIAAVRAVCQVKPTNYEGRFQCSDEMLTRIWYTGAYSVKANLCKDYFGSILMDRGDRISFTGDAHASQAAALVAFGNWEFIRQNLIRTAKDDNGIESYSLYWLLSLFDYCRYSGDTGVVKSNATVIRDKLEHAWKIYDNPKILFYGHDERLGACIEEPDRFETKSAFKMLFIRACAEYASILNFLEQQEVANFYRSRAEEAFAEWRHDENWFSALGVHALADAVNTGLTTELENQLIFDREFSDRLNRLSYSPFNQYFILQAMSRMGHYDEALTNVLDMWGGQIKYGGTTFFEVYRPCWNEILEKNAPVPHCQCGYTSLAHPWGGGVTKWVSEEILGIKPASPGFAKIDIFPHFCSALSSIVGSVPTPKGPVSLEFDLLAGHALLVIPQGSVARFGIPKMERRIDEISVDGNGVWPSGPSLGQDVVEVIETKSTINIEGLQAGRHEVSISYRGDRRFYVPPSFEYPLKFVREDSTTGGDWGGVHGKDGYCLWNYEGVGKGTLHLPTYVKRAEAVKRKLGGCKDTFSFRGTSDRRALASDPSNVSQRNVGYVHTECPEWYGMTMVVDIESTPGHKYNIAFYFLDWEKSGRAQQLELFDLRTLKLAVPVLPVIDFQSGKYMIYEVDRPIRLRVNHVQGENAVLSGIFFDPCDQ